MVTRSGPYPDGPATPVLYSPCAGYIRRMPGVQTVGSYPGDSILNEWLLRLETGLTAAELRARITALVNDGQKPHTAIQPIACLLAHGRVSADDAAALLQLILSLWNELAAEHNRRVLN